MKKIIVILLLVFFKLGAQNTNCWISYDYVLMGNQFNVKGLKYVKGVKATFCFNESAFSFYTPETGLISFNYRNTGSGIDTTYHNQVWWEGTQQGGNDWIVRMTFNHKVWINNNKGWAVQLQGIYHSENGRIVFKGKANKKTKIPSVTINRQNSRCYKAKFINQFDTLLSSFIRLNLKKCDTDTAAIIFKDNKEMPTDTFRISKVFPYVRRNDFGAYPSSYSVYGKKSKYDVLLD
jgi:hypothetical protein